jgi:hypothetical protein
MRVPALASIIGLAGVLGIEVAAALALPPSHSKLGIHLIINNTTGVGQIVNAHPRVIKLLDASGPMIDAARAYKAGTPDGIVVLRVYTTRRYAIADDPAVSASDFFNNVIAPAVNPLSATDRALIDYVEGPNECDSTPCWSSVQDATWSSNFWVALAPLIANAGFKPCAFSIPVGNPPGDITAIHQTLDAIVPALRACKQRGGAWSYHGYTPNWDADVGVQVWYSLRYRQYYSYFAQAYPDLANMPLILTEAGFDSGGSATGSGWQANGTASQYETWLTWWDAQIRQDSYVLGSTIFQIGSPATWPSFDLEPVAGWLAGYLDTQSAPLLVCSPKSLSATTLRGTNPASTTFTVTNVGHHAMSYSIADNATWLSVSPASGSSLGETDTIVASYTASGLAAGTYTGAILVMATGADDSPQTINVTLEVTELPVPGDMDGDRDVSTSDVLLFLNCMTGPQQASVSTGCVPADVDKDNDVDQSDFGLMQRCFGAEGVAVNANCAGQ